MDRNQAFRGGTGRGFVGVRGGGGVVREKENHLVDVSENFYFFSARGGGMGSPRCPGGGGGSVF